MIIIYIMEYLKTIEYNKIIKKNKIDKKKFLNEFDEPFSYMKGGKRYDPLFLFRYDYNNICMTLFNKNMKSERIDMSNVEFPRDIEKVYWYEKGKNDVKPWRFIGKIKCDDKFKYVYYIGECDYTGFDCQGCMKLYVSKNLRKIMKMAVEKDIYDKIMASCKININNVGKTK